MRRLMTLFAFVLVGLIMAASVDAQRRGTADKARRWADTNHRLELRYTLETEEDGEPDSAAATQGFESGDRFTLRVRPTDDAYLYLFVSDPDGAFTLVAPDPEEKESSPRAAEGGADARLPADTTLRLDEQPGVERLYLVASTGPLDEVEGLLEGDRRQVGETWLVELRDRYARNGTLTRQVRNEAVRVDYRQRGRGAAVVFETVVLRHYVAK